MILVACAVMAACTADSPEPPAPSPVASDDRPGMYAVWVGGVASRISTEELLLVEGSLTATVGLSADTPFFDESGASIPRTAAVGKRVCVGGTLYGDEIRAGKVFMVRSCGPIYGERPPDRAVR